MSANQSSTSGLSIYKRLFAYARPHWPIFIVATIAMGIYAATETGFAALMKPMLDESFVNRDPDAIRLIPLALIGLFLLRGIAGFLSNYGMQWVGRKVVYTFRKDMFERLLHLPARFFDNNASGQLVSKITYNTEQVAEATTNAFTIAVRDTLTAVGLLIWMFILSGTLSLAFLLVGPFMAAIVVYISRRFRRISTRIQNSMGDVTQVVQEAIDGHREVKTFGGHQYEAEHFDKSNEYNRCQRMKMVATTAASVPLMQFLAACALAGVVFLATHDTMRDVATPGTFVSFILSMLLLMPPLKRLTTINAALQKGIAAAESIFDLFDEEPEHDRGARPARGVVGDLAYRGVSFAYNPAKGPVLEDITFEVKAGQTIAFVGRSGSGKSTLVQLLPRFYDPSRGQIFLDGIDIHDYRLHELRDQIALVSQNVTLFNDTIARNIAYGALGGASEAQIVQAAEAAHAMPFIQGLPDGLATLVGENGVLLSGGQRQRLAIARAILKNAPVLILDEATSALDTESELLVQAGLEELMRGRTTLVIAHRLSTVEHADCILVLEDGRIVEQGTHRQLLQKGGHYQNLYQMQFRDGGTEPLDN